MTAPGPLPLAEFLASLSDLGIRTTLDDQRRITLVLRAGGPWTVLQLRGVLSSLLVRDRDKLAEFRRRFDSFFDLSLKEPAVFVDMERALAELRGLAGEPAPPAPRRPALPDRRAGGRTPPPSRRWRWRWSVLAALVALALLPLQEGLPPSSPKPADSPKKLSGQISEQVVLDPEDPGTTSTTSPALPFWATPWLLALAALGYAAWLWRWLGPMAKAPAPSGPPGDGPRLFRSGKVGGSLAPRLDRSTLDHIADSLGYFRSEESGRDLDPRASVEKTASNGGIPMPVFELRRQVRSVLILEDLNTEARAWNPIARELAAGLSQRGVPLLHGLFEGVPDRFRSTDGADHRIEDLEDERRGYLVLIFSDGKGLGRAAADFALERLAKWPQVAWMQLQDHRFWDQTAARPALLGLPVFPADRKGLLQAMAAFTTERAAREATPSPESLRGLPPRPIGGSLRHYVDEVLGDSLPWAQACAMVPPSLALGLADRIREQFHPDLPPERIERLIALPGSRLTAGGLALDPPVLAVLREGFAQQHEDQEEVLHFLMEQMRKAEPEAPDSLAHQAWEWRLERLRLELDPEPAVERLAELSLGPLGETIRTGLQFPLRVRPRSRYAAERLDALAKGRALSPQDLYRPRVWPEAGLAGAAVALIALSLWIAFLHTTPAPESQSLTRNTPESADSPVSPDRTREAENLPSNQQAEATGPDVRGENRVSLPPPPPPLPMATEPKKSGVPMTVTETTVTDMGPGQETDQSGPPAAEPVRIASREVADLQSPCPLSTLSRCGDACVDLRSNPFHSGACFTIAPSLTREAAGRVDSPPDWTDESIRRRRYYRVFYDWDDSKSSVIGRSLPTRTGWNRGEAPNSIELRLSSAEIAGTGYALAITDLEIHCVGPVRVASVNSEAREMYEKLSTGSNWRPFGEQSWLGPNAISTDTHLNRILATPLAIWDSLCSGDR